MHLTNTKGDAYCGTPTPETLAEPSQCNERGWCQVCQENWRAELERTGVADRLRNLTGCV